MAMNLRTGFEGVWAYEFLTEEAASKTGKGFLEMRDMMHSIEQESAPEPLKVLAKKVDVSLSRVLALARGFNCEQRKQIVQVTFKVSKTDLQLAGDLIDVLLASKR